MNMEVQPVSARRKRDRFEFEWDQNVTNSDLGVLSNEKWQRTDMPRRYRNSRRAFKRRRRGRRSGRRYRKTGLVQNTVISRKLPCAFYNAINAGAGTLGYFVMSLNSAYDVSGSASGALQAMGMDQYEALYNRYCVTAIKIVIEAVSMDNTSPIVIGFTPKTNNTAYTSYLHCLESPGSIHRVMTPDQDKVVFKGFYRMKPWLLPRGKLLTDDTVSAAINYDPSRLLYGHVWAQAQDSTADPANVQMTVRVVQYVVFYDRKVPARSTQ